MAIKGDRPCVLITGVGGRSVGHQILHALRLLGDKYRLVAVDADSFSFGLYQVDNRYLVPKAQDTDYIPAILEIINRESIDILLPGTEPEVRVLVQYLSSLDEQGCRLISNPPEVVSLCNHKGKLTQWLKDHDFGVPHSAGPDDWRRLVNEVGFPLVAKPTTQTGGSRGLALLNNADEVTRYLEEASDETLFQEYISSPDEEYTVGVLINQEGALIDSIVLWRKLIGLSQGLSRTIDHQTLILSSGYSQGFIIQHPLVQQGCEALARQIGARGPLNIQCRLLGDELKIFEVHPRFSGTTSIRAEVGFNEPDILIQNSLFGIPFGRLNYQKNVAAIRAFQHVIVPMDEMDRIQGMPSHER
ncbi:MAG: hypothetical protein C0407_01510 [Desulfobacca sp.]|nr:hypothetical protein [Desulfobacca sp.]